MVAQDTRVRERLGRCLSRYDRDYRVITEGTTTAFVASLRGLRDTGGPVALIVADQRMEEAGTDLLERTRSLHPTAQHLLVTAWADYGTDEAVTRASILGIIDHYATRPLTDADEQFHLVVSELLARWAREHGRRGEAVTIVGDRWDPATRRLADAFERFDAPHGFRSADSEDGRRLLHEADLHGPLPVVLLGEDRALARPTFSDFARALGAPTTPVRGTRDLVVLGAGPAGLAAAVHGASEGLSVLVVEPSTIGGQAGSSPMLRNYLGFPAGVTGAELTARGLQQAWTLGAAFLLGRRATTLAPTDDGLRVGLDDGTALEARSVLVAIGAAYRRIGIESVESRVGRGVFYGSGATEARAMTGRPVFVVGGGNSAGAAAVFLARHAATVDLLVRDPSIVPTMSDYLIQEIDALPNVTVRTSTEVVDAFGDDRLRGLVLRDTGTGARETVSASGLFVLIGATPQTDWLPAGLARDEAGYVLTSSLATTMAGVYAVGDVRAGSAKRIAAAVGQGSSAIRSIHAYLERTHRQPDRGIRVSSGDRARAPRLGGSDCPCPR